MKNKIVRISPRIAATLLAATTTVSTIPLQTYAAEAELPIAYEGMADITTASENEAEGVFTEEVSTEDTSTEDASAEEIPAEDFSTEDAPSEEILTEEASTEDIISDVYEEIELPDAGDVPGCFEGSEYGKETEALEGIAELTITDKPIELAVAFDDDEVVLFALPPTGSINSNDLADDGWVVPTDKEIAKDDKKREEEEKKLQDAQKAKQDVINEAGAQAGKIIVNLINGKYDNADAAIKDISITTLKFVNEKVIKNLPYFGGITSSIIGGMMEEEQENETIKRLDDISEKLDVINKTIERCTNKIMEQQESFQIDKNQENINSAYKNLVNTYADKAYKFNEAVMILGQENMDALREKDMKNASDLLGEIYSPSNRTFFNEFKEYCNTIMGKGGQTVTIRKSDIFTGFDNVVTYGKTGTYAGMEYIEQKKIQVDNVSDTCKYGYDMLSFIIDTDIANQESLSKTYSASLNALEQELENAPDSQMEMLMDAKLSLESEIRHCKAMLNSLKQDKSTLETLKTNYESYVQNRKDSIQTDIEKYAEYKPEESLEFFHVTYGTETINNIKAYPSLSSDRTNIEYRDCYGNLLATRKVAKEEQKVDQYAVKTGKIYHFVKNSSTQRDVKVTEVFERPCYIVGPLDSFRIVYLTIRTIRGIDIHTNEQVEIPIGWANAWDVYDMPVGKIINV